MISLVYLFCLSIGDCCKAALGCAGMIRFVCFARPSVAVSGKDEREMQTTFKENRFGLNHLNFRCSLSGYLLTSEDRFKRLPV